MPYLKSPLGGSRLQVSLGGLQKKLLAWAPLAKNEAEGTPCAAFLSAPHPPCAHALALKLPGGSSTLFLGPLFLL